MRYPSENWAFWGFRTRILVYHRDFVAFCPCSLRFLNASANKLETLPAATLSEETSSILQELYLTNNNLTDKCVPLLTGHPHLKILHMAYNRLQSFPARWEKATEGCFPLCFWKSSRRWKGESSHFPDNVKLVSPWFIFAIVFYISRDQHSPKEKCVRFSNMNISTDPITRIFLWFWNKMLFSICIFFFIFFLTIEIGKLNLIWWLVIRTSVSYQFLCFCLWYK